MRWPIAGVFFNLEITGWKSVFRRPEVKHVPAGERRGLYFSQPGTHVIVGPMRFCVVWRNPERREVV